MAKRKLLLLLFSAVTALCLPFGLAACTENEDPADDSGTEEVNYYTVSFVADGVTIKNVTYTDEDTTITEPAVPDKDGYTGAWGSYILTYGDAVTVSAEYTAIEYTATFTYPDGTVYAEVGFTIDGEIEEPSLPEVAGYTIEWESYTVSANDITVSMVYTSSGATAELEYSKMANGEWQVTGISDKTVTSIVVPETYKGSAVTKIKASAFSGCSALTSITLPFVGLTYGDDTASETTLLGAIFGAASFDGATAVTQIYSSKNNATYYIPDTLTQITITGGEEILYGAFSNLTSVKTVTLAETTTSAGSYAFQNCTALESASITGLTAVSLGMFSGCTALANITFGNITNIYKSAFADTAIYNDTNNWKDGALYINNYLIAFDDNSAPSDEYTVAAGTKVIGADAFCGNTAITTMVLPDGLEGISVYAFDGCTALASVNIPSSVVTIGNYAFRNCALLTEVVIPDGVTSIGNYAFDNCTGITKVTIPDGIESIGNYAFRKCTALTSIAINGNEAEIGTYVFQNCTSLASVTITGIVSIGNYAFNGCTLIESITLPNGLTSIGNYAFKGCSALKSIEIPESLSSLGTYTFDACTALTTAAINGTELEIGNYAFRGCTALTSVTIVGAVTLGNYVFQNCTALESVVIPDSVTSIGNNLFNGCTSLKEVSIGNGITTFYPNIFTNCTALEKLHIGSGLNSLTMTTIAFNLKEITVDEANETYEAINGCLVEKSSHMIVIGVAGVTIPDDGSIKGLSMYAFYGNTALTNITLPTYIGSYAFSGCTALEYVVISENISVIETNAFISCTALTSVYYKGTAQQWAALYNEDTANLGSATIYYYNEDTTTTVAGNYWYYDNGQIKTFTV